jgi:hypothetical protein
MRLTDLGLNKGRGWFLNFLGGINIGVILSFAGKKMFYFN